MRQAAQGKQERFERRRSEMSQETAADRTAATAAFRRIGGRWSEMKKVYISHPLRGKTDRKHPDFKAVFDNKKTVYRICRAIAVKYPDILPLSPINAFSFFRVLSEDEKALEMCLKLLELADELWVFGDWENSEGCRMEIGRARELRIPVYFYEDDVK
jgi:hypothetical protein